MSYRVDLVVEDVVVVELKCVERLLPVHQAQVLTYVRLLGYPAGLLINFNEVHLKDGLVRVVNGIEEKRFLSVDLRKGAERQTGQPPRY